MTPWQAIVDALPIAVVVLAPNGTVQSANAHASTLTGYARDELAGQDVGRLLSESSRNTLMQKLEERFGDPGRKSPPADFDLEGRPREGGRVPWRSLSTCLHEHGVGLLTLSNADRFRRLRDSDALTRRVPAKSRGRDRDARDRRRALHPGSVEPDGAARLQEEDGRSRGA